MIKCTKYEKPFFTDFVHQTKSVCVQIFIPSPYGVILSRDKRQSDMYAFFADKPDLSSMAEGFLPGATKTEEIEIPKASAQQIANLANVIKQKKDLEEALTKSLNIK